MKKIDFNKVCKDYGIRVFSYQSMRKKNNGLLEGYKELDSVMRESSGVCFAIGGNQPVIAFDADRDDLEIRYTVAHELGHILLGHLRFRSGVKEKMPKFAEAEANIFAAVLTANDILFRYGREVTK